MVEKNGPIIEPICPFTSYQQFLKKIVEAITQNKDFLHSQTLHQIAKFTIKAKVSSFHVKIMRKCI